MGEAHDDSSALFAINDEGMRFTQIADLLEPMDSPHWKRAEPE